MVDWALAERIADAVGRSEGVASDALPGDLAELADRALDAVVAYGRLTPQRPLPPPEAVERSAWARANLTTMRATLRPESSLLKSVPVRSGPTLLNLYSRPS